MRFVEDPDGDMLNWDLLGESEDTVFNAEADDESDVKVGASSSRGR